MTPPQLTTKQKLKQLFLSSTSLTKDVVSSHEIKSFGRIIESNRVNSEISHKTPTYEKDVYCFAYGENLLESQELAELSGKHVSSDNDRDKLYGNKGDDVYQFIEQDRVYTGPGANILLGEHPEFPFSLLSKEIAAYPITTENSVSAWDGRINVIDELFTIPMFSETIILEDILGYDKNRNISLTLEEIEQALSDLISDKGLLATVCSRLNDRDIEKANRQTISEATSFNSLPDDAPELWVDRTPADKTPAHFINRVYRPWLSQMHTGHIRDRDPTLGRALDRWVEAGKKGGPEEGFHLPSKAEALARRPPVSDEERRHARALLSRDQRAKKRDR